VTLRSGERFLPCLAVEPQGGSLTWFAGDFNVTDRFLPAEPESKTSGSFGGIAAG